MITDIHVIPEKVKMMNWFCGLWRNFRLLVLGLLLLVACQQPTQEVVQITAVSATPSPSTIPPLPTVTPSHTPSPTTTHTSTPTYTATATATPTLTVTPSVTPSPTATPIDRTCPDPPPVKPDYTSYYLSGDGWPTPETADFTPHFWLTWPLPGSPHTIINQGYPYGSDGNGRYLLHNGLDLAETLGTPVLAMADGTVVVAQDDETELYGWRCNWYGHLVVIQLDQTWQGQPIYVLYGHVLNVMVEEGQPVKTGDPVAEVGFGGAATVPHLHIEVRVGSNEFAATRNPALWIQPGEERGVIAGRLVDPNGRPWQGVTVTLLGSGENPIVGNTFSYLDDPLHLANPDETLAENFAFSFVRAGTYVVYVKLQGVEYRVPVTVEAGQISTVEIVTEDYKTPTPAASP